MKAIKEYPLMPMQRIQAICSQGSCSLTAFWDMGSNVNLMRKEFAEEAGWENWAMIEKSLQQVEEPVER